MHATKPSVDAYMAQLMETLRATAGGASASPVAATAPAVVASASGPTATTGGNPPPPRSSGGGSGGDNRKEVTVTIRQVGRGSLRVSIGDREIARGIFKAKAGDKLSLVASAGFRHFLYNIRKDDSDLGGENASTFLTLTDDVTVVVEFKKKVSTFDFSKFKLIPAILALALLASFAVQWRLSGPEWAAHQNSAQQQTSPGNGQAESSEVVRAGIVSNCEAKDDGRYTSYHQTSGCSLIATTGDKPMLVGRFKVTHMVGTSSIKYVLLTCPGFQEQAGSREIRVGDTVQGCFGATTSANGASFTLTAT